MARSVTQIPVTEAELAALVSRGFGPEATVAERTELTDGSYNAAYRLLLADGQRLILKVAPPAHLDRLRHEVLLMHTEVDFYRRAAPAGVPVPSVRFADFSRTLIDRDYVFLEEFQGIPLYGTELSDVDTAAVHRDLGMAIGRLHAVTGTRYGYPLRDSATWQPTWRGAYFTMIEDVLADAARLGTELPDAPDAIRGRLARHATALDAVGTPVLVHYDLWDGNIFIHQQSNGGGTGWRLRGLIDGERAFWGDPYAEFASLPLFKDISELPGLLDGYAAQTGRPVEFTDEVRARIALYTIYLYLLMVTEGPTRGFPPDDPVREYTLGLLGAQLDQL